MPDSDAEEDGEMGMFVEPDGFYEPEAPPTFVSYTSASGVELRLRLLGHSPLWGHLLWNAGRTLASYLESNAATLLANKTVLELGAGAGLPSLICALHGAKHVVVTDYPDSDLIENIQHNIDNARPVLPNPDAIHAEGYLWGASVENLFRHLSSESSSTNKSSNGFDLLILGDLLFNHSEHAKLLDTVRQTLKRTANSQALVFFTPYRPWLLEKDLAFFDLAQAGGFVVEKVLETVMDDVMFQDDPGDEKLRRTVFGYSMRWDL